MPVHFSQRVFAAQTLPKTKASRLELVLKDRLDHLLQCRLKYAVFYSGYTERTLPRAFGYVHTPHRLRTIATIPQCCGQFGKIVGPGLCESLHTHAVYTRRPGVPFDLCPSQHQRIKTRYLVDQTMPFASFNSSL